GNELSLEITPVMGRTGWAVGWSKPEFWGREALAAQKEAKESRLSGGLVVTGRGIPRAGCRVLDAHGQEVGVVTSGTFSPTRKQGVALALLDRGLDASAPLVVDVRGREVPVEISKPPFVTGGAAD
ncbi:MAG: glycine cleavage system protein T, partial [Arsenicicoccus sp.]